MLPTLRRHHRRTSTTACQSFRRLAVMNESIIFWAGTVAPATIVLLVFATLLLIDERTGG